MPHASDFGFKLKRFFYESPDEATHGSFWEYWGGHLTADHVIRDMEGKVPAFTFGAAARGKPDIDACLIGCNLDSHKKPRKPIYDWNTGETERVFVYGYPAGSNALSGRSAKIIFHRNTNGSDGYNSPTYVGQVEELPADVDLGSDEGLQYEIIVGGMSGGLVMSETGEALGILATAGASEADQNIPNLEYQFDFVALSDVWDIFSFTGNFV